MNIKCELIQEQHEEFITSGDLHNLLCQRENMAKLCSLLSARKEEKITQSNIADFHQIWQAKQIPVCKVNRVKYCSACITQYITLILLAKLNLFYSLHKERNSYHRSRPRLYLDLGAL